MVEKEKRDVARFFRRVDVTLIFAVLALIAFGVLMIYSATCARTGDPFIYLKKQVLWIILGLAALIIIVYINYNAIRHYTPFIYAANIILLIAVAIVGVTARGAQRWIPIFGFKFQPSEFAKIILIITLAAFLATRKGDISKPSDVILALFHIGVPMVLIALQPDLGTALVLVAILMGMLLAGGTKLRYYAVIILVGVLICFLFVHFNWLNQYQMNRLMVFFNPSLDPKGAGYNLLQSKIAIGSGGIFGKGLFSGTQTNLKFLPHSETDFIFSVIGEELGFVGALILISLYFMLVSRAIRIAGAAKNMFGSLVAVGILSMWIFQIVVNIGMTIGIMPITGIPLPFISYGGSSLLTHLIATGLLLNIYTRRLASAGG